VSLSTQLFKPNSVPPPKLPRHVYGGCVIGDPILRSRGGCSWLSFPLSTEYALRFLFIQLNTIGLWNPVVQQFPASTCHGNIQRAATRPPEDKGGKHQGHVPKLRAQTISPSNPCRGHLSRPFPHSLCPARPTLRTMPPNAVQRMASHSEVGSTQRIT
jgi:hypothetical protein